MSDKHSCNPDLGEGGRLEEDILLAALKAVKNGGIVEDDSVRKVLSAVDESANEIRLKLLCVGAGRALESGDKGAFLGACMQIYEIRGASGWNQPAVDNWRKFWGDAFDRLCRYDYRIEKHALNCSGGGNLFVIADEKSSGEKTFKVYINDSASGPIL
jgi:hypothetical protein